MSRTERSPAWVRDGGIKPPLQTKSEFVQLVVGRWGVEAEDAGGAEIIGSG